MQFFPLFVLFKIGVHFENLLKNLVASASKRAQEGWTNYSQINICKLPSPFSLALYFKKKKPDFLKWLQNQQLGAIPETKCS